MSDPKQRDLDSVGRAASWLRERSKDPDPIPLGHAKDRPDWPTQGKPDETVTHLRPVEPRDWQIHKQSDVFAEAVARAMQEQGEPDLVEAPSALQNRHAFGSIAARFAVCRRFWVSPGFSPDNVNWQIEKAASAVAFAVVFASEVGPGFSLDISTRQKSGL